MALSYEQAHGLRNDDVVNRKAHMGVVAVAKDILDEATPSAERLQWAKDAMQDPAAYTPQVIHYILISNMGAADPDTVRNASDASYKTNVDAAIDKLIAAS